MVRDSESRAIRLGIAELLVELHIRNFALIDDLRLEMGPGLGVLTGETGAGKSIIVDALIAALGERTGSDVVRTGSNTCLVEAVFDVRDGEPVAAMARDYGFEPEDDLLIVSREIARAGRSQCRVNGRPATSAVVREITSLLVDVHGQHEHQSLLSIPLHIDLLDGWIGQDANELRSEAERLHLELSRLREEQARLLSDERERARMLDLYKFQAEEIESARLNPNEEEALLAEKNRLANAEKLFASASEVREILAGEHGVVDALAAASSAAQSIAAVDESMAELAEALNSALYSAQDAVASARDYADRIEANPTRLEQVEERLDVIRTLKRKYGDTVQDILKYGSELGAKINGLEHAEERAGELDESIKELQANLQSVSAKLRAVRKKATDGFEKALEKELSDLAMERTRFEVGFEEIEPGPKGADAMEFLISPNPGEPVKPLAKIASGGEMSRIMLALKTVMSRAQIPSLIFDEIDTGIGGRTAQVLGEKLAALAGKCQVMCVTHLPQIASKAGRHFRVDKIVRDGRSVVRVRVLEGEERVLELARMLGAQEPSAAAAQHAREMLALAGNGNTQAR